MSEPTPWSVFEDDVRPADLLVQIHRLFQDRQPENLETVLAQLRPVIQARLNETLIVIWNEIFVGLIREKARCLERDFREPTINLLLRPAVVFACTAMETYLTALLRKYLQLVIARKGWRFYPENDGTLNKYFEELRFTVAEVTRLLDRPEEAPLFVTNKILNLAEFKYLGSKKGIHVVGTLLGVEQPWKEIAGHLDAGKDTLQDDIEGIFNRRNDIVHRADRPVDPDDSTSRTIKPSWAERALGSVRNVCRALDEMVTERWGT